MHKKAIKLQKNAKKLLIFTDFLVWEELISSWIFKMLIYSPPRGGANLARIFTLVSGT